MCEGRRGRRRPSPRNTRNTRNRQKKQEGSREAKEPAPLILLPASSAFFCLVPCPPYHNGLLSARLAQILGGQLGEGGGVGLAGGQQGGDQQPLPGGCFLLL